MMKKQRYGQKLMALGLSLCLMLGGAVGLAEEDAQVGALEGVMESMAAAESLTLDAQFAVRQNGEDVITGDAICQFGSEKQYASATALYVGGEAQDLEMSISDGNLVIRIGDEFYSMPVEAKEEAGAAEANAATEASAEEGDTSEKTPADYLSTVLGQLFGSVADSIAVSETGLGLHLAGDDVPTILNLVVSMVGDLMTEQPLADSLTSETGTTSAMMYGTRGEAAKVETDTAKPTLTLGVNLHIDRIDLDIAVEGEAISGIQCSIVLTGKDAQGAVLETELAAVVRFVDINATEPGAVDMTGVEMKPLEQSGAGIPWRNR